MSKTDIYRSFEQWKNGNVLEHGVPRTEYYSEAQLDLVEMGWNYGYDAGRAVEQALDKKAENARELGLDYEVETKIGCVNHDCDKCKSQQEPVAWMKPHPKCDSACLFQCTHGFTQFPECAATPQAQPAREPLTDEPEIVQRVKRFAGQTLRTARNPNITARECIELADWLAAHGITGSNKT